MKGKLILWNAVIWGVVMIACAIMLRNTGTYPIIQSVLTGGFVWSMMMQIAIFAAEKKKQEEADKAAQSE